MWLHRQWPGLWSRSRRLGLETYQGLVSVLSRRKLSMSRSRLNLRRLTSRSRLGLSHWRLVPIPDNGYTMSVTYWGKFRTVIEYTNIHNLQIIKQRTASWCSWKNGTTCLHRCALCSSIPYPLSGPKAHSKWLEKTVAMAELQQFHDVHKHSCERKLYLLYWRKPFSITALKSSLFSLPSGRPTGGIGTPPALFIPTPLSLAAPHVT